MELVSDRLLLLSTALFMSLLAAMVPLWLRISDRLAQPVVRLMLSMARKLNRSHRSTATLVYRGLVLVLFWTALAAGLGMALNRIAYLSPYLVWVEVVALMVSIPAASLYIRIRRIEHQIKCQQLDAAQRELSTLLTREHIPTEPHALLRLAIETLTENLSDRVVASILFYLAFGLPALLAVRAVHLLDQIVGYRSRSLVAFGWAAAKCDDLLQWIPARLSALLMVIAACVVPGANPFQSVRMVVRSARATASPNAGWPLAAMAGALNISLAGPRKVAGSVIEDAWIGTGTAKIAMADFRRAKWLYVTSIFCVMLAGFASIYVIRTLY